MSSAKKRLLTWLLSGAALMSVVATAGCSSHSESKSGNEGSANSSSANGVAESATGYSSPSRMTINAGDLRSEPAPPKVNVFGEFDGVERPAIRQRGGEPASFQQHTYLEEGFDGEVSVDPKGQWLVFSSTRNSEHADIYLQRVNGLSVTQLTTDSADDAFPVFSRDGSKIAFCSTRAGNWDIYLMDIDGKNIVQITNSPVQELHPSFSPDGTRLVYCALGNRSGQWELWTVSLITGEKRMIGFGLFPSWSPTKERDQIAFQKARARGSRWFSLWTLDLIDGEARNVTEIAVSSNAAIVSPTWSPDGKKLSFATVVEPAQTASGKPRGQQDIWTVNTDGTDRHRITDGNGICATPYWAADNRIYFVSDRGGTECVWSARAEQSNISTAGAETKELTH